jgi:hypothetical protein
MRAFVILLAVVAAPIYFGHTMLEGIPIGGYTSFRDIRDQVAASDLAHDAVAEAHDYAAAHPSLVESLKALRTEFRRRFCSVFECSGG